jgi:hypothetical protein
MVRTLLSIVVLCLLTPVWAQPDYSTPEQTLQTYLQACKAGDFAQADACYTRSSREFLAKTPKMTEGRMPEHLMGTYDRLAGLEFTTEKVGEKRAILRPNDAKVPPFYMRVQDPKEGWRIDWQFMANYMRADANGWSWVNPRAEGIWKSRP